MKFLHKKVRLAGALEGASPLQIWWQHILSVKTIYFVGTFSVLLTTLAEVAIPRLVKEAIDTLTLEKIPSAEKVVSFQNLFWILILLLVVQYIGRILWRITLAQQTHHVGAQMKSLLWNRARYLPQKKLDKDLRPGDLMNIATSDVNTARFGFGFTIVLSADVIFLVVLTLGVMFSISVELTLWTLVIVPGLPFILSKLSKQEGILHDRAQKTLSDLSDLCAQAVSTIRLQRLTQTSLFWKQRLLQKSENYRQHRQDVIDTDLKFIPYTGIAPIISYVVLLVLGVRAVFANEISVGSFVAMQSYIFLIQVPMIEMGHMISEWQRAYTSLKRISSVYQEKEYPQLRGGGIDWNASPSPNPEKTLYQVSSLSFAHQKEAPKIIDNLSLQILEKSRVGILGPVGSGKTTLLNILAGFERDFDGNVSLDSRDIRNYSHDSLRSNICLVPQKPFLFADTIRANLNLEQNHSENTLWQALEWAGVREDIESLPQGLDTKIGEWGVNLSGGQKQRLTLARALIRKPRVLFLDDCLSAIDTVTEEKVLKSINENLKDTTIIWVAHRRSTLKHCKQIIELGNSFT